MVMRFVDYIVTTNSQQYKSSLRSKTNENWFVSYQSGFHRHSNTVYARGRDFPLLSGYS